MPVPTSSGPRARAHLEPPPAALGRARVGGAAGGRAGGERGAAGGGPRGADVGADLGISRGAPGREKGFGLELDGAPVSLPRSIPS